MFSRRPTRSQRRENAGDAEVKSWSSERGTALMLMPAGVLIVLILGGLAVDSAVLFLGERELADLSAAAANDAATAGLREATFYECGRLELDPARAERVAHTVAAARTSDAVSGVSLRVVVDNAADPPALTVAATGTVRLVFSPALPGVDPVRTVAARSVAVPEPLGPGAPAAARC